MNKENVLDHGFVVLRNISGPTRRATQEDDIFEIRTFDADDTDPANSARMSFDQTDSGRTREQDLKLSAYLLKNRHTTPFEMIEVWLEMKLPIFVARQFVRHRTVSINEVSGRYVQLPEQWYVPALDKVMMQSADKKQGGRLANLNDLDELKAATEYVRRLDAVCQKSYDFYKSSIEHNIAMEQARLSLHLNHYTHWIWKQNLHNLMHFMSLRDHSHAQFESQEYARAVDRLIRKVLPTTMALYDQHRKL